MRFFYDTEFIEDGKTIDLISIGIVAEDGSELYLVNEEIGDGKLYDRIVGHNWLMENVVPSLPLAARYDGSPSVSQPGHPNVHPRKAGHFHLDSTDNRVVPVRYIRNAVREFLLGRSGDEPRDIDLWAWYGAYDHVVLAQLFGPMISLPPGIPMWTNDLRQEVHRLDLNADSLVPREGGHHNALEDARWNRDLFNALTQATVSS